MKRIMKKMFAMLMTLAMVMGMSMTAFAAKDSAVITVKTETGSPLESAQLSYVQLIEPDGTTETGWKFSSAEIEKCFEKAFDMRDDQKIIQKIIKDNATTDVLAKALSNVQNEVDYKDMQNPLTVTKAGLYAVKAVEDGYTYNNMTAYVGFGETKEGNYPKLEDAEVVAKRTPTTVGKTAADDDNVVQIGDIVTYTVETTVPFIDPNASDKSFKVFDDINGAAYYLKGNGSVAKVEMGGLPVADADDFQLGADGHGFVIDLSNLIDATNSNAGKTIKVTYTAKVTEVSVDNTAGSNIGGSETDSKPGVDLYSAEIIFTKFNEDRSVTLAGAEFTVKKDGETLKFDETQDDTGMNVYTYNPEGEVTTVVTANDGKLKIVGLDVGTYTFEETKAPEGYTKNTTPKTVEITLEEGAKATGIISVTDGMTNTKMSALPSTGGIGTTIFTIAGCVIMISAAGLFFVNRRRAQ